MSTEFPTCNHAGRELTGKRFCRKPGRPDLPTLEVCTGCPFAADRLPGADPRPPEQYDPPCQHRGPQIASIVSCQCPESWGHPVFECSLGGLCVRSKHNRESIPRMKCCETCTDREPGTAAETSGAAEAQRPPTTQAQQSGEVDLVITCHDYGRFLSQCLDSIINQTTRPASITVVDDASTDDTAEICERFRMYGVDYLHTEHRDVVKARRDGMLRGSAEFVLFVDADNYLPQNYLASALSAVDSPNVVCVYPNLHRFGDDSRHLKMPDTVDRVDLSRRNYCDNCSLLRRSALDLLDLDYWTADRFDLTAEDYILAQSLARIGGEFRRNPAPLHYRVHEAAETTKHNKRRTNEPWARSNGLDFQPITLFIPLAGRRWAWQAQREFLNRQHFPHDRLRLILCDTSQDAEFATELRDWIASSDYTDARHFTFQASTPGLADQDRRNLDNETAVSLAMCRIYNRMRSELTTDYVWILEDDVIPPDDNLPKLIDAMAGNVATVFGPYPSRFAPNYVCWKKGTPGHDDWSRCEHAEPPQSGKPQVVDITGSGFGNLFARSEVLRRHLFQIPPGFRYYDPHFFHQLGGQWRRLAHWGCLSTHLEKPTTEPHG